jgi:hypothetical protein
MCCIQQYSNDFKYRNDIKIIEALVLNLKMNSTNSGSSEDQVLGQFIFFYGFGSSEKRNNFVHAIDKATNAIFLVCSNTSSDRWQAIMYCKIGDTTMYKLQELCDLFKLSIGYVQMTLYANNVIEMILDEIFSGSDFVVGKSLLITNFNLQAYFDTCNSTTTIHKNLLCRYTSKCKNRVSRKNEIINECILYTAEVNKQLSELPYTRRIQLVSDHLHGFNVSLNELEFKTHCMLQADCTLTITKLKKILNFIIPLLAESLYIASDNVEVQMAISYILDRMYILYSSIQKLQFCVMAL